MTWLFICELDNTKFTLRASLIALAALVAVAFVMARGKCSRFGAGRVEFAHNPLQQGNAIENRLQKGSNSGILLSILISV